MVFFNLQWPDPGAARIICRVRCLNFIYFCRTGRGPVRNADFLQWGRISMAGTDGADLQGDKASDMAGFFRMMRGKNLESVVNEAAYVQRILEEQSRRHTEQDGNPSRRSPGPDGNT